MGAVSKNRSCRAVNGSGPRPTAQGKGRRADDVGRHRPAFLKQPWRTVKRSRPAVDTQVWAVKAAPVWPRQNQEGSRRTPWLIWARNVATGEEKDFLSHAPAHAQRETLVRGACRRWHVEHALRVGKRELGFWHDEGRNYTGLMRHPTLCLRMRTFVAGPTEQLRGEKSGGDEGAGLPGVERAEPGVAGEAAGDHASPAPAGRHRLPPAAEQDRTRVPPAKKAA